MVLCTFLKNLYNWEISQYSSNGTEITEADLNFYIEKAGSVANKDTKKSAQCKKNHLRLAFVYRINAFSSDIAEGKEYLQLYY